MSCLGTSVILLVQLEVSSSRSPLAHLGISTKRVAMLLVAQLFIRTSTCRLLGTLWHLAGHFNLQLLTDLLFPRKSVIASETYTLMKRLTSRDAITVQ